MVNNQISSLQLALLRLFNVLCLFHLALWIDRAAFTSLCAVRVPGPLGFFLLHFVWLFFSSPQNLRFQAYLLLLLPLPSRDPALFAWHQPRNSRCSVSELITPLAWDKRSSFCCRFFFFFLIFLYLWSISSSHFTSSRESRTPSAYESLLNCSP